MSKKLHCIYEVLMMEGSVFLPLPEGLCITEISHDETGLLIKLLSEQADACCPLCSQKSDAVHSRYQRRLKDVPTGGQAVRLSLTVRKFFCHTPECKRKIFTERLPTFVAPWAQMTLRLVAIIQAIGGFEAIKHMFSDDFAIAHLCRTHGYGLAQSPVCHGISTRVRDARHYFNLLQRWFVFPRESILRYVSLRDRMLVYLFGIVPTLFPLFLLLRPSRSKFIYALLYFGCSAAIVDEINKKYLRRAQPADKAWLVPIMHVLIPVQILCSLFLPQRANWRGNVVQVEPGGGFRYIRRHPTTSPARVSR